MISHAISLKLSGKLKKGLCFTSNYLEGSCFSFFVENKELLIKNFNNGKFTVTKEVKIKILFFFNN